MKTALVTIMDKKKHRHTVFVENLKGVEMLQALIDFLRRYTDGVIVSWEYHEKTYLDDVAAPVDDHAYDTVNLQNVLLFRDEQYDTVRLVIPAPAEATLDAEQHCISDIASEAREMLLTVCEYAELTFKGGGLVTYHEDTVHY